MDNKSNLAVTNNESLTTEEQLITQEWDQALGGIKANLDSANNKEIEEFIAQAKQTLEQRDDNFGKSMLGMWISYAQQLLETRNGAATRN